MQLGLYVEGTKEECLLVIDLKAKKEKARFSKLCSEHQVFTGFKDVSQHKDPQHKAAPITDTTSADLIDKVVEHFKEQIEKLGSDERCSLAFQITIHTAQE